MPLTKEIDRAIALAEDLFDRDGQRDPQETQLLVRLYRVKLGIEKAVNYLWYGEASPYHLRKEKQLLTDLNRLGGKR